MPGPVHYHEGSFPPSNLDWNALIPLLGPAAAAVARYDGTLSAIPNAAILLSPLTTQEAVLSSRIEGTQATMGEVLEYEASKGNMKDISAGREADIQEVLNYRKAMRHAEGMLRELPLCQRVVCEAHKVLMTSVRGNNKGPGDYRRIPNWIGPPGCTMETATYVPISAEKLPDAMGRWEKFVNGESPDRLVQLAIAHAEFEALHPFLDGNGRLGRMLAPLFMWQVGLIQSPMFYISAYFERDRGAYYSGLTMVSRDRNWTGWCRFFLEAVRSQAEDNYSKAKRILGLYNAMKLKDQEATRSQYTVQVLDWIFGQPIFKSSDFVVQTKIPARSAARILESLQRADILKVSSKGQGSRASVYAFPDLLNIAEGPNVF
jgi:Fic family protein